jgi:hypothetical protein
MLSKKFWELFWWLCCTRSVVSMSIFLLFKIVQKNANAVKVSLMCFYTYSGILLLMFGQSGGGVIKLLIADISLGLCGAVLTFFLLDCAANVILCRHAITSLLFLITVFCMAAIVYLALAAEFLGVIFLIVYIGAVAILFLFVIMLLRLKELAMMAPDDNMLYSTDSTASTGVSSVGLFLPFLPGAVSVFSSDSTRFA